MLFAVEEAVDFNVSLTPDGVNWLKWIGIAVAAGWMLWSNKDKLTKAWKNFQLAQAAKVNGNGTIKNATAEDAANLVLERKAANALKAAEYRRLADELDKDSLKADSRVLKGEAT